MLQCRNSHTNRQKPRCCLHVRSGKTQLEATAVLCGKWVNLPILMTISAHETGLVLVTPRSKLDSECPTDAICSQSNCWLVPYIHHQWSGAGKGARLCATEGAILCWQPWHGHCWAKGQLPIHTAAQHCHPCCCVPFICISCRSNTLWKTEAY